MNYTCMSGDLYALLWFRILSVMCFTRTQGRCAARPHSAPGGWAIAPPRPNANGMACAGRLPRIRSNGTSRAGNKSCSDRLFFLEGGANAPPRLSCLIESAEGSHRRPSENIEGGQPPQGNCIITINAALLPSRKQPNLVWGFDQHFTAQHLSEFY